MLVSDGAVYPLTSVLGGVELRVDGPLVIGCYSMNSTSPAVSASTTVSTIHDCLVQCRPARLVAVTNGTSCFCFDTFPQDFLIPSQGCTIPCPGNSNFMCGGPAAFSFAVACKLAEQLFTANYVITRTSNSRNQNQNWYVKQSVNQTLKVEA